MSNYNDYVYIKTDNNFTNDSFLPNTSVEPSFYNVYVFTYNFLTQADDLDFDQDQDGDPDYDILEAGESDIPINQAIEYDKFDAFTSAQQEAAKIIMHESATYDYTYSVFFSDVAKILFTQSDLATSRINFGQVSYTDGDPNSNDTHIEAYTKSFDINAPGAEPPPVTYEYSTNFLYAAGEGIHGDIWLNKDVYYGWNTFDPGGPQFQVLIHEMGHALGLIHPWAISEAPDYIDNHQYTTMSYTHLDGMVANETNNENYDVVRPAGLQLLDIQAIQEIYGRNYLTRGLDDLNTLNINEANTTYDESGAFVSNTTNEAFIYTIWDGAGNDKIDASDYSDRVFVDLRQGHFSSIGNSADWGDITFRNSVLTYGLATNNVAIAYHTVIENAIGTNDTSYGDILIGNDWKNDLRGLQGNDTLFGDGWVYDGSGGFSAVDLDNPDGVKPALDNDILRGGLGQDTAFGGYGNDHFFGEGTSTGLEGDLYYGGGYLGGVGGNLIAYIGDGCDTVNYELVSAYGLTINLIDTYEASGGFAQRTTGGSSTQDKLYSIENAIGSSENDIITGSEEKNILIGMEGDDTFYASREGDVFHGGYDSVDLAEYDYLPVLTTIPRANDGSTDVVNYTNLSGVYFDITILDLILGNYWVDKYYGNAVFNGPNDRDTLFSIEAIVWNGTARQVGGTTVYGTSANDHLIYGSTAVAYSFYGLGGIDQITGGNQNDYINGGADDDTVLAGKQGDDTYFYGLGDGNDTIADLGSTTDFDVLMFGAGIGTEDVTLARYFVNGTVMTVTIDNGAGGTNTIMISQNYSGYGIDYMKFSDGTVWDMQGTLVPVYGTEGNDVVVQGTHETSYREGSLIDDLIYAYGGNDNVQGYGGNDTIHAGDGVDTVHGGYGDDLIYGGAGNDALLEGSYGDDLVYGEDGHDLLRGNEGNDILDGGNDIDTLYGGNDNDILYGRGDNDTLRGENHNDTLYGGGGLDSMYGGGGTDIFVFEAASAFQNIDIVNDYNKTSQNDKIDISDVLYGFYDYGVDVITDFVQITQSGVHSLLYVDQDGGANSFLQIAALYNVSGLTNEAGLEASGHLITV